MSPPTTTTGITKVTMHESMHESMHEPVYGPMTEQVAKVHEAMAEHAKGVHQPWIGACPLCAYECDHVLRELYPTLGQMDRFDAGQLVLSVLAASSLLRVRELLDANQRLHELIAAGVHVTDGLHIKLARLRSGLERLGCQFWSCTRDDPCIVCELHAEPDELAGT